MKQSRTDWVIRVLSWSTVVMVLGALASALAMSPAHAQTVTTTTALVTGPTSATAGMLQGLVGLVIVVGLIYAAAWMLKRVGPRARSSGIVQVLGGASVGPREKVVVVRFGGETLLLGVASGHVSLLHTAVDGVTAPTDEATAPTPRFIDRLRAARSGS